MNLLTATHLAQANLQQGRFADQGQFSEKFLVRLRHSPKSSVVDVFSPSPGWDNVEFGLC